MSEENYYKTIVQWKSGRIGQMSSPELDESIECATPPEFPGGVPGIWSPEHFFTASVNSCFMTTFLAVAENFKLKYKDFSCKATGKLSKADGKWMMTEILLEPEVVACADENPEKVQKVLEKAEKACLITNSIKSTVLMKSRILHTELCG